ncbi:beta-glucanase (GH16 family) [Saccharopolyspora lacisalsi]|uniref:Beta-glucanase (GH16 family) n=1 Tax=Halosaccharopolyspora lacisalsi TaxID=1000566 RepID=A0A839DXD7_9PSEU|nr:glycoside hydrolase family 16 protein [Halosaccharopolyspora lacisalsi]MBA8826164.1 beta-glucanase (GH16 family) [Halosaccharopolyspora lacisalsi]
MSLKTRVAIVAATALLPLSAAPAAAAEQESFFDDFSGASIDRSKWTVEVTGENFGTVNSEQQAYVDSPDTLYVDQDAAGSQNGALAIHPRYRPGYQAPDGNTYDFVSGRLKSQGKMEFTYGTYSVRLKLPEGASAPGLWPAAWSLGSNIGSGAPWPECGEIDLMEHVGEPWTSVALHGPGYSGDTPITGQQNFSGGNPGGWHVYSVDWRPDGLTFSVDGTEFYRVSKADVERYGRWVFDSPQFSVLNFALGGSYPHGVNGVNEPYFGLPQSTVDKVKSGNVRYLVDWVRVEP